jgi:hypothetical protein
MRKRTQFAEGRAQLARVGRREAKIRTRRFKAKAESLEATVATLTDTITERDAELRASKAQIFALKDYIAAQFADRVHALGAAHPLAEFQRAADVFASKGGKVGRSVQPGDASGHQAEHAPTTEHEGGLGGGVMPSGAPDGAGESTDSDDEDFHIGLARKRRRTSSAGLDRPLGSAVSRRRAPSSGSGVRRKHPSSSSSGPRISALAAPASSGPEKPPGRSSWNSRSAQLDVVAPPVPSLAAAVTESLAAAGASSEASSSSAPSRKRKSPSPPADSPSPAASSSSSSSSDSDPPRPAQRVRNRGWSDHEKECLIEVVRSHFDGVRAGDRKDVHDTGLWELVQARMVAEYGIDRGVQACRMTWNRGLREQTGIDERLRKDPNRMATSVQRKGGGGRA